MAIDAGSFYFVIPDSTATSATPALSNDITLASAAVVGGFFVPENMTLVRGGVTFTTAGTTTALVWKASVCRDTLLANAVDIAGLPIINESTGAVTAASVSCTAPAAAIPIGTTISKPYNYQLYKGDFVVVTITTATTAGTGYFSFKCVPSGDPKLGSKLQSTTVVAEYLSTT